MNTTHDIGSDKYFYGFLIEQQQNEACKDET